MDQKAFFNCATLFRSLCVTVISLLVCWIGYIILDVNVLNYISKQDSEVDVINFYYLIHNRNTGEKTYDCFYDDQIVVVDLDACKSRAAIADVINRIEAGNPKVIALDFIFPDATQTDSLSNALLRDAVASCKNIVTACRSVDGELEQSFFTHELNISYGLVNSSNHYQPYYVNDADSLWFMPYLVTHSYGEEDHRRMVNYWDKAFLTLKYTEEILSGDVEGRIVLIGDLREMRDMHDMPFNVGGKTRVTGTMLMAYKISTILHDSWIIKLSVCWGILIAAVLVFFFAILCYHLRRPTIFEHLTGAIEGAIATAVIVVLMIVGYMLFAKWGVILNLVYAMIALALTSLSMGIVELGEWGIVKIINRIRIKKQVNETNN